MPGDLRDFNSVESWAVVPPFNHKNYPKVREVQHNPKTACLSTSGHTPNIPNHVKPLFYSRISRIRCLGDPRIDVALTLHLAAKADIIWRGKRIGSMYMENGKHHFQGPLSISPFSEIQGRLFYFYRTARSPTVCWKGRAGSVVALPRCRATQKNKQHWTQPFSAAKHGKKCQKVNKESSNNTKRIETCNIAPEYGETCIVLRIEK